MRFLLVLFICIVANIASAQNHALLFAVNDYQHFPNLKNPIRNAEDIAAELRNRYNFTAEVVKNPTRAQVRQKLMDYSNDFQTGRKDKAGQLFLFFSGHGEYREQFGNGYWVPADGDGQDLAATTLSYSDWRNFIDNMDCKHILVAIDACYSGTFDPKIAMRSGDDDPFKRPNEPGEAERILQDHQKRTARLYLASGAREKTPDKSEFAKRLLTGLRRGPSRFGILPIDQIFVEQIKMARPTPIFGAFGEDEAGSSFLFVEQLDAIDTDQVRSSRADLDAWKRAQAQNTVTGYQAYLDAHPSGRFSYQARQAKLQLDDESWSRARQSHTIESYETYLQAFPGGKHISDARRRIQEIADDTEWEIATALRTKEAYEQYLRLFPEGRHIVKARQAIADFQNAGKSSANTPDAGTFTDRDNNTYGFKTMKDGKRWMTKNLNLEVQGAHCYGDKEAICQKYGRLYTWEAAKQACALLGDGWRLPTDEEWKKLGESYGGYHDLVSRKDIGNPKDSYEDLLINGSSGFAAQLGGIRYSSGSYYVEGADGSYWSSTARDDDYAWFYDFNKRDGKLYRFVTLKTDAQSVRCLQD